MNNLNTKDLFTYITFDLLWKSSLELNQLEEKKRKSKDSFDVEIRESFFEYNFDNISGPYDTSFLAMQENNLYLNVDGVVSFNVKKGNSITWYRHGDHIPLDDIKSFLLGSAMGAILIQRDYITMHGNALEKNGSCIVCLGKSGSGKSTMAYALMQKGWRLLSDDLVAITKNGYVLPGIPRIKLWKDSAEQFGIDFKNLPKVRKQLDKYILTTELLNLQKKRTPISKIYFLSSNRVPEIKISENIIPVVDAKDKLILLRNNIYRPRFYRGLNKEGNMFIALSKLQKQIECNILKLPNNIKNMKNFIINI